MLISLAAALSGVSAWKCHYGLNPFIRVYEEN